MRASARELARTHTEIVADLEAFGGGPRGVVDAGGPAGAVADGVGAGGSRGGAGHEQQHCQRQARRQGSH